MAGMREPEIVVLVITGPVGAGKSTVAAALSEVLEDHSVRHALIDLDALRQVVPNPPGDQFAVRLGLRNLAAVWPNYRALGIDALILADVVEDCGQVADYERAMPGAAVIVVRLDVPMELILARLARREGERTLAWYRRRAPELQEIMERHGVGDVVISVGARTPHEVALEIARLTGLVTASPDSPKAGP